MSELGKYTLSYAEVNNYYPDTQTISVTLLPEKVETTDIPVCSPFTGNNTGVIRPFYKGQQVLVGSVGSLNNLVLINPLYNEVEEIPPTEPGIREKYGKLTTKILNPYEDYLITTKDNIMLFNDDKGIAINSNKYINMVSPQPISVLSNHINQIGSVNINMITNLNEKIDSTIEKLDDMNNKWAQVASLAEANKSQIEKQGVLMQLVVFVTRIIGLNPIQIVDPYDVYPELSGNPFTKFFKKSMTNLKAIQYYTNATGVLLEKVGLDGIKDELNDITQIINQGQEYSDYIHYLDFDSKEDILDNMDQYRDIVIQNLPEYQKVRSNAKTYINKALSIYSMAKSYFTMVKKTFDRLTNTAFFKKEKTKMSGGVSEEDLLRNDRIV